MSKYFYHLDLPPMEKYFIQEAESADFKLTSYPNLYTAESSFHTMPFFKLLDKQFGQCYVKYYLNPPNSFYDWHVDMNRYCVINWVVKTNKEARTFFREPIEEAKIEGRDPIMFHLTEVDYCGTKPTLLDATYQHCVANNYNEQRIILSMSLYKPTTYAEVLDFLKPLKIQNYSLS
jgi:hypothetical protein